MHQTGTETGRDYFSDSSSSSILSAWGCLVLSSALERGCGYRSGPSDLTAFLSVTHLWHNLVTVPFCVAGAVSVWLTNTFSQLWWTSWNVDQGKLLQHRTLLLHLMPVTSQETFFCVNNFSFENFLLVGHQNNALVFVNILALIQFYFYRNHNFYS